MNTHDELMGADCSDQSRPTPSISVVIPTAGKHRIGMLAACLDSIAADRQDDDHLEIVVVADGGDPHDYEPIVRKHRHITLLAQKQAGPAAARNRGWRHSTGDVIAFLDDDTMVTSGWLRAIREYFSSFPHAAGAGGPVAPLRPTKPVSRMMTDMGHLGHRQGPHGRRLVTANATFRRTSLESVDGFDERFLLAAGEDFDLCDRMGQAGLELGLVEGAIVLHHHPHTIAQLLSTCARYRAGVLPDPTRVTQKPHGMRPSTVRSLRRLPLPKALREWIERVICGITFPRRLPRWYRIARRSAAQPSRTMAAKEALIEMLWYAEWVRLGL